MAQTYLLEQIAAGMEVEFWDRPEMQVLTQTIYQSLSCSHAAPWTGLDRVQAHRRAVAGEGSGSDRRNG